jgi:hypothetical protein
MMEISPPELGRELSRFRYTLQSAHRSSIDIKSSYDFYILAFKEYTKENFTEAFLYYDRARYELTNAVNDAKHNIRGFRIHSSRTISFFFKLYGLYSVVYGILMVAAFSLMLSRYADIRLLDVPLWSCLFAGLGSSAQLLTGIVDDLRLHGMVVRYKRLWYMVLPVLSIIFGYIAYLVFSSGLVVFNVSSQDRIFTTMLVCFIAGFGTNWLIGRLSALSKNMS